jgi:transposase-like protein
MVMVRCIHCESEKLVKDGYCAADKSGNRSPRYRCRGCGKRSSAYSQAPRRAVTAEKEAQVLALLNERNSQRGIARALQMSRSTIVKILEKKTL